VQTFLPYPDFKSSVKCLDNKRLGKQRVEAYQILNIVSGKNPTSGWRHHPAVLMWFEYENALKIYMNEAIKEWISRSFKNTMEYSVTHGEVIYPWWFGVEMFHASHRSNLLRKDFEFYSQFGWKEPIDLPYFWPRRNK
jgi:hypothetical protein